MATTVVNTFTFEDWVEQNGGRGNAFETKDDDGKLLLLFMTGAKAQPVAAGTYIGKRQTDDFALLCDKTGKGWLATDSPGDSGSLAELEAAARNAETALTGTRNEFDRKKESLQFYAANGVIQLTDEDEKELHQLREKADHYNAVVKQIAELIAAHPEKKERDERSRRTAAWKADLEMQAQAQRIAAQRRIGSIQYDR